MYAVIKYQNKIAIKIHPAIEPTAMKTVPEGLLEVQTFGFPLAEGGVIVGVVKLDVVAVVVSVGRALL